MQNSANGGTKKRMHREYLLTGPSSGLSRNRFCEGNAFAVAMLFNPWWDSFARRKAVYHYLNGFCRFHRGVFQRECRFVRNLLCCR